MTQAENARPTDAEIRSRVDELLAGMTTAEKAGQLTQYFYFAFMRGADDVPTVAGVRPSPEAVEAAMGRGEVGSLLFVTEPVEINRLQRLASKAAGSASRSCSATT